VLLDLAEYWCLGRERREPENSRFKERTCVPITESPFGLKKFEGIH
jgi:hypothetical protein